MSAMSNLPPLKFYNTLTRSKEEFAPIDAQNVRMYVCGPTVYDYAHIGNARPAIVFDVLFRLLRHVYGENHVTYVRNITDVDDKINARALRDFPDLALNEAIRNVTEKTASQYFSDMKALGCLKPSVQPRATDHITGMVAMIQTLIERGNAYIATGKEGREVLFSVGSMPSYGQLSNRKLEDQQAGARVAVEEHKRNPADFVLWKESAFDEPGWPGAFSEHGVAIDIHGRPGWHIECSVMSAAHLGETFDIHGGGLDLIFPHHENEIAQSVCAHGNHRMANVWMHNGFLQVEGQKMSKSLGNFVTVNELLETEKLGGRKWPGEVLRLAMLMTHYREPIDFSVSRLEEAEAALWKWAEASQGASLQHRMDERAVEILSEDLNFSALKVYLDQMSKAASNGDEQARNWLRSTLYNLGFGKLQKKPDGETAKVVLEKVDSTIGVRIKERLALIADKNWAEADRIRDELLAQGIQLKDGKDPETGERVTAWEVKR